MSVDTTIFKKPWSRKAPFAPTTDIPETNAQTAIERVQSNMAASIVALAANDFLVKTASATLSAERVVTDTATIAVDWATAAQAKFNVVDDSISDAKLRNSAAVSVIGRSANSAGDPADIAAGANDTLLRRVSDAVGFGALTLGMAAANLWTYAKLQQGTALSVLGVTGNATANLADIAAATDNQVMRRSGTAIGFGAVNLASSDAVTGDLPFANLAQGSALSVLGVAGNATADNASIAAANDAEVLRRSGTVIGFGTVATAGIADDAVTYAKIQNVSNTDRLLGRDTAAAGNVEEISLGASLEFSGSASIQRAALTGAIVAAANSNATTSTFDIVVVMGGTSLATGIVKGVDIHFDFACTIVQWTLTGDASGSLVLDLWKDTYANYPPTVADTITASAKPTISTATKGQSSTLTGWTTSVSAGDIIRINVDSVTTIVAATLILKCTKTS